MKRLLDALAIQFAYSYLVTRELRGKGEKHSGRKKKGGVCVTFSISKVMEIKCKSCFLSLLFISLTNGRERSVNSGKEA